jgi:PTS system fructose-specific IIC component
MKIWRYLKEDAIRLQMSTVCEPLDEGASVDRWRWQCKEQIIDELVTVLEQSARIGNRNKLVNDFIFREKKASTAIGHGIAIPHIRSKQAKDFMLGFARSEQGYDFDSPDEEPTRLFFVMAAPPYDDSFYLKVFRSLGEMLQYETFREELMAATDPGEIIRAVRSIEQ